MCNGGGGCFAVVVVEIFNDQVIQRYVVKAAGVDVDAVGVGAGHVEGFDAAMLAEEMAGGAGVEAVFNQLVFAGEQGECGLGHDQVQKAGHPAD
jgi:hypothetical protein